MNYQSPEGPVFSRQTVQESVVDYLRNLILGGQLLPGERLVQNELADRLGVSRTPVREALHILASEGLVTLSSYKGASVAEFSLSDLQEVYTVRTALEGHAAYLAAQRISDGVLDELQTLLEQMEEAFHRGAFGHLLEVHHLFHVRIITAAGQERLEELAVRHLELTNVYQRMALSLGRGAKDPVVEHQEILETLRRRDGPAAGRLLRTHLEMTVAELAGLFHGKEIHEEEDEE